MYTKEHINILNHHGMLSSSFLMKKEKITKDEARKILNEIVKDFINITIINLDQICVEGKQYIIQLQKKKIIKKYIKIFKNKSKWKDVTKP